MLLVIAAPSLGADPTPRQVAQSIKQWTVPDAALGWAHAPAGGRYAYDADTSQGLRPVVVTLWPGGERATSAGDPAPEDSRPQTWVFGCSFTFGFDVSDEDSYPWQLQLRLPARRVRNFGVEAYSTYQALLALRQRLASEPAPAEAVYGLADFQEERNAGAYAWLAHITYATTPSRRRELRVPYCALRRDGTLHEHAPEPLRRTPWPFVDPLVNLDKLGRARHGRAVTRALLQAFIALCREHGIRPVIVHLDGSDASRQDWQQAAVAWGVTLADARSAEPGGQPDPGARLWHPAPRFYHRVAATLADALQGR